MRIKSDYPVEEVLAMIQKAIETGAYDFTSKKSIRIFNLSDRISKPDVIEVEWKTYDHES